MSAEVDTAEVRKVARQIREIVSNVKELSSADLRAMKDSLKSSGAEGETAKALREALNELDGDILSIAQGLTTVERRLNRYAEEIEEADRRAAEAFKA